jgi:hypothetical protein
MCSVAEFGKEELPGTGLFGEPTCKKPATEVGLQQATVFVPGPNVDAALEGPVFNLPPPEGRSSNFGVALKLPIAITKGELEKAFAEKGHPLGEPLEKILEEKQYYAHSLIEGNVEWGKEAKGTNVGDYHDYFEIEVSPALPLISSRLVFFGTAGTGEFVRNATSCPGHLTTILRTTDLENTIVSKPYTPPEGIELNECGAVPFEPGFNLVQGSTLSDKPDQVSTEFSLPHNPKGIDNSQVMAASVTLPEGLTLNTAAAAGLEACTPAQARIHSEQFGTECPSGSQVATATLNVPGLPDGSLTGNVYLGGPEAGPITGPPYTAYIVANSKRFGISVRLKAEVIPNETTGQLTTVVNEPPEQPFSNLSLQFNRGMLTALANPLSCGTPAGAASFHPYAAPASTKEVAFGVSVVGCGAGPGFTLTQLTSNEPSKAGAGTSYGLSIGREDGQQYLQKIKTTLPSGLLGLIPTLTLCGEPQASQGNCPASSRIGNARIFAGAGPFPYPFAGPVYMTGPYNGAPFGMSIPIEAAVGPFDLGTVVTRSTINVDQTTARVTAESVLPTIVKGVPIRLRLVNIEITRQGFLINPTNCSPEATETTLTSTFGAVQAGLSNPFHVESCSSLAFKPAFSAASNAHTSRANGASLETTLNMPVGDANVKSVHVTLPEQLPSRLTTLQKSCPEATFAANPNTCPSGSFVGGVRANTPTLNAKLKGPAILVSHGGAAFPDLDLLLEGEGVKVVLVGNTDIKKGITTTTFAATPDAPVSSITVNLPTGPHSALAAFGDLCAKPLKIPTTLTGQNGVQVKQTATINVKECGVKVVGKKVVGNTAKLTIKTFGAGRVSGSGSGLVSKSHTYNSAQNKATLELPLTSSAAGRGRPFKVSVHVKFASKSRTAVSSSTTTTVVFN